MEVKNLNRMSVATLALSPAKEVRLVHSRKMVLWMGGAHEWTDKIPRLRIKITVVLACVLILTPHSMGIGISACGKTNNTSVSKK